MEPRQSQLRPTFSLVIPVWNEEQVIPVLYERLVQVMEGVGESWEVIFVNDGSTDRSLDLLLELHARDPRVKVLNFSRNFGHQIAITAGFDYADGDAVIVMDADLQDPPEVLLRMIDRWREGYDVVYAVRIKREGESKFKLWTAAAFYRLIHSIADVEIPLDAGDFRLMDRRVVLAMRRLREKSRFMRGLSSWVGFKQIAVEYERAPRYAGETKYPLRKMMRLAFNAITSFSHVPLQLATYTGFVFAGVSGLGIIIAIFMRLMGNAQLLGQATTLVSVLFLGGVQLIFLGIIGEYLGRIYDEVKNRPLYIVADAYGFDAPAQLMFYAGRRTQLTPHADEPTQSAGCTEARTERAPSADNT
ncbi:MAG: glycosyltransferase family 2 protein [Caldilinea sp.]|nr:glycosyltransferase family 2 protein [Caldilinea sp.]MDW8441612.1 glycosyltransferase family 2 protein [Caldilineaceae bacterium]